MLQGEEADGIRTRLRASIRSFVLPPKPQCRRGSIDGPLRLSAEQEEAFCWYPIIERDRQAKVVSLADPAWPR